MTRRTARDARRKEQKAAQRMLLLGEATEAGSSCSSEGSDLDCCLSPGKGGDKFIITNQ